MARAKHSAASSKGRAAAWTRASLTCTSHSFLTHSLAPPDHVFPQARVQNETNDAKNALEAYIYSLRNK